MILLQHDTNHKRRWFLSQQHIVTNIRVLKQFDAAASIRACQGCDLYRVRGGWTNSIARNHRGWSGWSQPSLDAKSMSHFVALAPGLPGAADTSEKEEGKKNRDRAPDPMVRRN